MSLSLFRRSSSIDSKFRWVGVLRFSTYRVIPIRPLTAERIAAIMFRYLREILLMKSTIFCRVASGSSPGNRVATATAAVRRAVTAPRICVPWLIA